MSRNNINIRQEHAMFYASMDGSGLKEELPLSHLHPTTKESGYFLMQCAQDSIFFPISLLLLINIQSKLSTAQCQKQQLCFCIFLPN